MNTLNHLLLLLSLGLVTTGCGPSEAGTSDTHADDHDDHEDHDDHDHEPPHIDLPPVVVSNLGVTFVNADHGQLGVWREVPGELRIPEHRRFPMQSPAHAHVVWLAEPWSRVEQDEPLVRLHSPELSTAQSEMVGAERELARTKFELDAAQRRLIDAEELIEQTRRYLDEVSERASELKSLIANGGSLARQEALNATRMANDARRAVLDAEIRRDQLRSTVSKLEQQGLQAELAIERVLHRLGILTGLEPNELLAADDDGPRWRSLEEITIKAPSPGTVVELSTAIGLPVDHGDLLVTVVDATELHFHGVLPESALGTIPNGAHCELRVSGRSEALAARLFDAAPIADAEARSIRVDARVPNDEGHLVDGLSAVLAVRIAETSSDTILVPEIAVVKNGLVPIVFRKAPVEEHEYRPAPVELGRRANGFVEVLTGLEKGDQIVANGARQVLHAFSDTGGGSGGHMHADGTWHEDH